MKKRGDGVIGSRETVIERDKKVSKKTKIFQFRSDSRFPIQASEMFCAKDKKT